MDVNWSDPNLLIGDKNPTSNEIQILREINLAKETEIIAYIEERLKQAYYYLWITHLSGFGEKVNYLLIKEQPKAPVNIIKNYREKRKFAWVLEKNPKKWQFVPDSLFYTPNENPSHWRMEEFIREMSFWGLTPNPERDDPINGHYTYQSLWHMFDEMTQGGDKDKMREMLYCTNLIELKPHYDFSIARRIFAKNIYPISELAQRAGDEHLLWFCMEYSGYLNALPDERKVSKDNIRTRTTEVIRNYRNALSAAKIGIEPNLPTIDLLQKEGADWRLWIRELILSDAIRLCWEGDAYDTRDIEYHCHKYLNAWAHHNGIVGHRKGHNPLPPKEKGKPSRGRGRPPKRGGQM
jgi:hypothetical protein